MSKLNTDDTEPIKVPQNAPEKNTIDPQNQPGDTQPIPTQNAPDIKETQPIIVSSRQADFNLEDNKTDPIEPTGRETGITDDVPPKGKKPGKEKKKGRWPLALLGLFLILVLAAIGTWLGYQNGIQRRINQETGQIAMAAVTQFQLALEDESAGRLEMARKRFEYVIRLDPNFPGAQERLTEVMLHMAETAVPTEVPTPTPIPVTPTPDLRGIEEKFNAAVALVRNGDWDNAITALELLRKEDIAYRTVEVDGMLYIALRFRGVQKILGGNLEPGIYDLRLSEGFAPLDREADSYRSWARYYLTGSSFWEIDWEKVVQIFGEIYPYLPNLRDGSGWTAQERFRLGSIHYADQLALEERWCDARFHYAQALALVADERVIPTATAIQLLCEPPTPTPTATSLETPTPTPTLTPTTGPTEDLSAICCPVLDPNNPDPRCETYTCPSTE